MNLPLTRLAATIVVSLAASALPAAAGTVSIAWDPVADTDLAGYRVYSGTSAGSYSQSVDVGNVTATTLDLADCQTWYVAVKAYDAAGNESLEYSNEVSGWAWMIPHNDIGSVLEREITSFDDPRLESEDPLKSGIYRTLQAIPADIRRRYLINAGVTGPFSQVCFLMGLERVVLATIDDPAGLHRAIEKRLPLALQWVEEMAALDPGCIWIGEGLASSSLISPKTYREFDLPYEKVVVEKIHQAGLPSVLHICGKLNPALDLIPETHVNCLEADWQVDLAKAKARICDRVCLKGNLNTNIKALVFAAGGYS